MMDESLAFIAVLAFLAASNQSKHDISKFVETDEVGKGLGVGDLSTAGCPKSNEPDDRY